jgi:peptidoglycan/xylan/chitin deacetylase (PgdA/CDA1 family)
MTPRRDPVPRARRPWSWLGGILVLGLLAAGLAATAVLLWEHVDMQAITRSPVRVATHLPEPVPPAPAARPATGFDAYVYRSEASAGFFPDDAYHPSLVERWVELVGEVGGRVVEIRSAQEVEALGGEGVVVAPTAICLDQREVDALLAHAHDGGGLLITWATGARDGRCEWRGWQALRDLTASLDVRQVEERPGMYLTVPAGLPLSHGIEPAARVELRWDAQVALATRGPRVYWSDWAMNPAPTQGTDAVDVAAHLHATDRGGRVVWFGFNGDEAVGPLDRVRAATLLRNGIAWAAGIPSAEILPWPGGRRAAVAVVQEVGWEFENSGNLARLARARGVPVTFFVASRLALDHPGKGEVLAGAGELGSRSSDDRALAGLPYGEQRERLDRSFTQIQAWAGETARGLRPPTERFDGGTLRAWRSLGGTYLVGVSNGRTGSPEVHETPAGPVVVLPRVIKDDYNVLVQDRAPGREALARELVHGLHKMRSLGGLALLTTHTQLTGSPRHVDVLGPVLDTIQADGDWWPVTGGELADWALARRASSVSVGSWREDGIEVEVRAPEGREMDEAWLEIALPGGADDWEPRVAGIPTEFARTPWGIAVPLGFIPAGEARRIVLRRTGEEP